MRLWLLLSMIGICRMLKSTEYLRKRLDECRAPFLLRNNYSSPTTSLPIEYEYEWENHVFTWDIFPQDVQFGSSDEKAIEVIKFHYKESTEFVEKSYSSLHPIMLDFSWEAVPEIRAKEFFGNYNKATTCFLHANAFSSREYQRIHANENFQRQDICILYFNFFLGNYASRVHKRKNGIHDQSYEIIVDEDRVPPFNFTLLMAGKIKSNRWCFLQMLYSNSLINEGFISHRKPSISDQSSIQSCRNFRAGDSSQLIEVDAAIEAMLPLGLDNHQPKMNITSWESVLVDASDEYYNTLSSIYDKTFIAVIPETNFFSSDNVLFLTEKTMRPISFFRPFMIIGNKFCLEWLRRYGFKTFHPFIDETYDTTEDDLSRMTKIVTELRKIISLSAAEKLILWKNLIPIMRHNYFHFHDGKYFDVVRKDLTEAYCGLIDHTTKRFRFLA